jgi:hypothetical protein
LPVFDALEPEPKKWESILKFEDEKGPQESNLIVKKRIRKPKSF